MLRKIESFYLKFCIGLAIFIVIGAISSCGQASRMEASYTGYSRMCVDGVQYLQFTSGATVAYETDGRIKTCK
jgi:hypothetical protein